MGLIKELIKGLRVTGGTMIRTIAGDELVTTEYPKEMRVKPQRFHGRHVLNRYPDGMEKCIGCQLCAGAARRSASMCGGWTTIRRARTRRASGLATSTRSTCCAASSVVSASRPAPPRQSP